jgi:hypothetical protein
MSYQTCVRHTPSILFQRASSTIGAHLCRTAGGLDESLKFGLEAEAFHVANASGWLAGAPSGRRTYDNVVSLDLSNYFRFLFDASCFYQSELGALLF